MPHQIRIALIVCLHVDGRKVHAHILCHTRTLTVRRNSPRLTSVRATHSTSATNAGRIRTLLMKLPYFFWKGSIMVTYLFSLMGFAKKKPPGRERKVLVQNKGVRLEKDVTFLSLENRNRKRQGGGFRRMTAVHVDVKENECSLEIIKCYLSRTQEST